MKLVPDDEYKAWVQDIVKWCENHPEVWPLRYNVESVQASPTEEQTTTETSTEIHCWESGPQTPDGCSTSCILPDGHEGPHEWTRNDQIKVLIKAADDSEMPPA